MNDYNVDLGGAVMEQDVLPAGTPVRLRFQKATLEQTRGNPSEGKEPVDFIALSFDVPSGDDEGYSFTEKKYLTPRKPGKSQGGIDFALREVLKVIAGSLLSTSNGQSLEQLALNIKTFVEPGTPLREMVEKVNTLSGTSFDVEIGLEPGSGGFGPKQTIGKVVMDDELRKLLNKRNRPN